METSSTPKVEGLHDRLELAAGAMLADLRLEMIRVVLAGPELIVVSGSTFRHGSAEWRVYGPVLPTEARRFVGCMTTAKLAA